MSKITDHKWHDKNIVDVKRSSTKDLNTGKETHFLMIASKDGDRDASVINISESDVTAISNYFNLLERERNRIWIEINTHIKSGSLGGNGTDKTAERNGLILASNIIHGMGLTSD